MPTNPLLKNRGFFLCPNFPRCRTPCPVPRGRGGIGRRTRLKIWRPLKAVPVRLRPPLPPQKKTAPVLARAAKEVAEMALSFWQDSLGPRFRTHSPRIPTGGQFHFVGGPYPPAGAVTIIDVPLNITAEPHNVRGGIHKHNVRASHATGHANERANGHGGFEVFEHRRRCPCGPPAP